VAFAELAGGVKGVYQNENKKGTYIELPVEAEHAMANRLEELRALEREMEREWWWLNGALHAAAQARAEWATGKLQGFRAMQAQAREVDRRRVEIAVRIAEMEASLKEPA
jgi:hypothetical protein